MGAPTDRYRQDLISLRHLIDEHRHVEAGKLSEKLLTENPDSLEAQYLLCRLLIDTDKGAIALPTARYLVHIAPEKPHGWLLLGAIEAALQRPEQALEPLLRAIQIRPEWPDPYKVLATVYVMLYRLDEAEETARKALAFEDHHVPHAALAFAALHRRDWATGWREYRHQLGRVPSRDVLNYGLPEWEGQPGSVLVYAEQGLGDQLCYISALTEQCKILVTHPKLESLIKRTVSAEVHGDQFKTQVDWDFKADYQCSMASAMQWQKVERRGRWLKPHPDKSAQWAALMYQKATVKQRPWIGVAWTGGMVGSHGWKGRNLSIGELAPILALPANFVSLEYRAHALVPNVHYWPWATQTAELDDFAALVDNLSAVVCVPTTAYHVAGSLGIPAHVIVHDRPHFHEGVSGECPWWTSVKFYRRSEKSTADCIAEIADTLRRSL